MAATGVSLLSLLVSWLTMRLRVPGRQALDILAFIPIAVPGVMIGVALIYVYIAASSIVPIYGTIWIIVIAYLTQYLPFGTRVTSGVMMQIFIRSLRKPARCPALANCVFFAASRCR